MYMGTWADFFQFLWAVLINWAALFTGGLISNRPLLHLARQNDSKKGDARAFTTIFVSRILQGLGGPT